MHVGFYQFTPRFGEVSHNLDMIVETLDQADADLIVLPELCCVRLSVRVAARSDHAVRVGAGWTNHTTVDRLG